MRSIEFHGLLSFLHLLHLYVTQLDPFYDHNEIVPNVHVPIFSILFFLDSFKFKLHVDQNHDSC